MAQNGCGADTVYQDAWDTQEVQVMKEKCEAQGEQKIQEEIFEIRVLDNPYAQREYETNGSRLHFTSQNVDAILTSYPQAQKAVEESFPLQADAVYRVMTENLEYFGGEGGIAVGLG